MSSKCRLCGSSSYGRVYDNRHDQHVHIHGPDCDGKPKCIYCGGTSCSGHVYDNRHPNNLHELQ